MKLGDILPESYWAPLITFKTRATVRFTRHNPCIDERVWLTLNARGRYTVGVTLDRKAEYICGGAYRMKVRYHYDIQFEDMQDAMLFKLTFGGDL